MSEQKNGQTNEEILGRVSKFREPSGNGKGGRPKINRELVIRYLKMTDYLGNPLYTYRQIASKARCGYSTVKKIKKEAEESGELETQEDKRKALGMVEADFNDEVLRARGTGFLEWLKTRFENESDARFIFNFTSRVWEKLWDKCSMVDFMDMSSNLAEQCAMKFLEAFGDPEDKKRLRRRLKDIRYIYRHMRRKDVCDSHLQMPETRAPRSKRKVPEITFLDFPAKLQKCIDLMVEKYGPEAELLLRFKICSQMRTGSENHERELFGLKVGDPECKSYIIMKDASQWRSHIFAKKGEEWDLIWLPKEVREDLFRHYESREMGQTLFSMKRDGFRRHWTTVTERVFKRSLTLHDLRKVSITWLYTVGVPSEIACMLNVGWKDASTALTHYLDIKPIIRRTYREQYRDQIPDWFKEGLEEFMGHEAMLPGQDSSLTSALTGTQHF